MTLLDRLISFSEAINPQAAAWQTAKKIRFWAHDIESRTGGALEPLVRLDLLVQYFFDDLGFRFFPGPISAQKFEIPNVVQDREGDGFALSVLFASLAQHCGIELVNVRTSNYAIVKWVGPDHTTVFFDCSKNGRTLNSDELIETVQKQKASGDIAESLEPMSAQAVCEHYLIQLKELWQESNEKTIKVLDLLVDCDSKRLDWLCERAHILYTSGRKPDALRDLKRAFSFMDPSHRPASTLELFDRLQREPPDHTL